MPSTPMYAPRQIALMTGTTTDASGVFPAGNVVARPANPKRAGLIIRNPSTTNPMYVNFGAPAVSGAAGSIPVAALGELRFTGALPSESVNVIGTAGQNYTIKEIN